MGEYEIIRTRAGLSNEKGSLDVRQFSQVIKKEELIRLILLGNSTRRCAEMMNMSIPVVRSYLHIAEIQNEIKAKNAGIWARVDEEISLSRMSMAERITEMSDRALEKISKLLESDDERIVMKAASDVLDRNPESSKHHKVEQTSVQVQISSDQLRLAAQAALEIDGKTGKVL